MNLVVASLNPDPGKLYLNTESNDRVCQKITLTSEDYQGKIKVRDVWATKINEGANINKYNADPKDFGITLEYPKVIENFNGNTEVEVCVNQKESMKAKGAIIFTPDSGTNVVVENGVWLFINLKDPLFSQNINTNTANVNLAITDSKKTSANNQQENLGVKNQDSNTASPITGAAVGVSGSNGGISIITIIIIVGVMGAFIALFTYKSLRRRRLMEYGY
ncbi:hypothetical protein HY212_06810 [Candidatus Pacearchaeota archaeon]|nr:hypothetical protein [Candidatus Pacearchaeota archaeon]